MASSPPESPEFQPENASPELLPKPPAEPRLLTRRAAEDLHDGNGANGSGKPLFHAAVTPRTRRPRFHPLQQLGKLRAPVRGELAGQAHAVERPRRQLATRALRRTAITLTVLLAVSCGALLAFVLFLRHDMRAALPQLDGDVHLAGLSGPVTVSRDEHGVPAIEAANVTDLLFAQGFVTAQDRLWQMDALRRHVAGELAEIMGPSMVEHDRQQRILQLRAAADRAVLTLPADQLAQLQAYARGVNAFLEIHADKLPVEFHLLHYTPAPWTPRDSLLVGLAIFQDLSTGYPVKLHREAFARHLPPELLADLYPTRSFRDQPPTQPRRDLTVPQPEVLQIPLDDSQVKLHIAAPLEGLAAHRFGNSFGAPEPRCPECRAGSNNWAVSGSHTASGKPLVSNDMHLGLAVPDIWYEAGLHTTAAAGEPALDVSGFTLPGVPFVIVGRNAHVAWGFTNLGADVQDVHIEHLRGTGDGMEYQQPDGSWTPVAHHRELIRVRGGRDRELDVLTTATRLSGETGTPSGIAGEPIMTPLIDSLFSGEHRPLSLLWTAYDARNLGLPFLSVNSAANGAALVASLASFGGPSLNLLYADDAGHIGYHAVGRIPVRGPAEHHQRTLSEQPPPPQQNTNPLPDEGNEGEAQPDGEKPQAQLFPPAARFVTAAYAAPRRRQVMRRSAPAARQEPSRALAHRAAVRHARRGRDAAASPLPQAPEQPILPLVPPRDYTVGLPLPSVPIDALDAAAQWSGYVPFEELPAITDPPDGVLATANARVTADDYPYFLADDWAPPYRVERIRKLLAGRTGLAPADMLHIETDTTSAFDLLLGQRLAYAADHAADHAAAKPLSKDAKRLQEAADLLRTWSGDMTVDSPAAAIVSAVRPVLWSMLIVPQIARHDHLSPGSSSLPRFAAQYDWAGQTVALESLLTFQPERWLPPGYGSWNDLLTAALLRALAEHSAPHDLSRWKYGSEHRVDIEHPLLSMSPLLARLLGVHSGTGAQPIGGDGTTIQATSRAFGPSERFTADLTDPGATLGNITTGQSGNPASPHFLDQFPAWLHGASFAMPLHGAPAQHTLRLLP